MVGQYDRRAAEVQDPVGHYSGPDQALLVAVAGGQLVGLLAIQQGELEQEGELARITVRQDWRRTGIQHPSLLVLSSCLFGGACCN